MPRKKHNRGDDDYDTGGDAQAVVDNRDAETIMMDVEGVDPEIKRKAEWLRANMTALEKSVWKRLGGVDNSFGFLRQYPRNGYYLDFFSLQFMVDLEIDGTDHINRLTEDLRRDNNLMAHGITTIRLNILDLKLMKGTDFYEAIKNCLENSDEPEEA